MKRTRSSFPWGNTHFLLSRTFRNYAIVLKSGKGIIGIDRKGPALYSVLVFDNGPDDPSDALFRIITAGKIGYDDSATGKIVIKRKYASA